MSSFHSSLLSLHSNTVPECVRLRPGSDVDLLCFQCPVFTVLYSAYTVILFLSVYVYDQFQMLICFALFSGAGCSSVDSVPAFEAVGRRIDPSQWTQRQFGLFSVPTSGPQLIYQRPWYVLFCLRKSAYKRSLAAYRKE